MDLVPSLDYRLPADWIVQWLAELCFDLKFVQMMRLGLRVFCVLLSATLHYTGATTSAGIPLLDSCQFSLALFS